MSLVGLLFIVKLFVICLRSFYPHLGLLCVLVGHACNSVTSLWSMGNCTASSQFVWINIVFVSSTWFVWQCQYCCECRKHWQKSTSWEPL